jgi:hypothetical protein
MGHWKSSEANHSKFEFRKCASLPGRRPVPVSDDGRTHPFQHSLQAREIDGFREIHVEPGFVSTLLIGGGEVGAHGDRGQVRRALPRFGDEVVSVPVRQADIAQDNVHFIVIEKIETAGHAIARRNGVSPAFEDRRESSLSIEVVLDEKNGAHWMGNQRSLTNSFGNRMVAGRVFSRGKRRDFPDLDHLDREIPEAKENDWLRAV